MGCPFRPFLPALAVALIALPAGAQMPDMSALGGGGDPAAKLQQAKEMCKDAKSNPQIAQICASMPNLDGLTPESANTMQGSGPGMGPPGAGKSKIPSGMEMLPETGELPAPDVSGAVPGMPGAPGVQGAAGGAQRPNTGQTYGGGPSQSHIPSIGGKFRGFSDPNAMRQRMMRNAPKPKPKPEPKPEPEEKVEAPEPEKKEPEKPKSEPIKKKPEKEPEKTEPAPAPPPKPVPLYANRVLSEFTLEAALLKNVNTGRVHAGTQRISDLFIPEPRPSHAVQDGIIWETIPDFKFQLYPLGYDPFNMGFPKTPQVQRGFLDRLLDRITGLFKKGEKKAASGLGPYLSFKPLEDDARTKMLGAPGIVPMSMYWSGPEDVLEAGARPAAKDGVSFPAGGSFLMEPELGDEARVWGLER